MKPFLTIAMLALKYVIALLFVPLSVFSQSKDTRTVAKPSVNGLLATYYNGINFDAKVLSRIEKQINLNLVMQSPAPGVNKEYFSIRWTGKLFAPQTGKYTLIVSADDGIRLWVNGVKLIDNWREQRISEFEAEISLQGGRAYDFRVDYFNTVVDAYLQVEWKSPEDVLTVLGTEVYSPQRKIPEKYLVPEKEKTNKVTPKKTDMPTPELAGRNPSKPAKPIPKVVTVQGNKKPDSNTVKLPPITIKTPPYKNIKSGDTISLKGVLFRQSDYRLLPEAAPQLDEIVAALKHHSQLRAQIAGHTDNIGNPVLNQALSENRARVVANYLVNKGIDEKRVETVGYGGKRPLYGNDSEENRRRNRRVEIVVR